MANDLVEQLQRIRYDLTAAQAKLTDALDLAAQMPDMASRPHVCDCGLTFKSSAKLSEHVYTSHDGPQPAHWLDAESEAA